MGRRRAESRVPSTRRRPRGPDGKVGGHFLESAAARTLNVRKIKRMTEDEALDLYTKIRWFENGGEPECPHCRSHDIYRMTINRKLKSGVKRVKMFKCAGCRRQFTPTSGTRFERYKLGFNEYIEMVMHYVNGVKGRAALELARTMGVQPKTAFVILGKIRESLGHFVPTEPLTGEVEIDTAGYGGRRRKKNLVKDRKHSEFVPEERKSVVIIRQRGGAVRAFMADNESKAVPLVLANVSRDAVIFAEDAPGWNRVDPLVEGDEIAAEKAIFGDEFRNARVAHLRTLRLNPLKSRPADAWVCLLPDSA